MATGFSRPARGAGGAIIAILFLGAAQAQAGGFNRASANLDGLLDDGIAIRAGVTFAAPRRSYAQVSGALVQAFTPVPFVQNNVRYAEDQTIPWISAGGRIADSVNCVASYAQPYGGSFSYSGDMAFHISEQTLRSHEYGLTCARGAGLSHGRISVLAGGFHERMSYRFARNFETAFPGAVIGDSRIDLASRAWGWRAGIGYEIPEAGLKATLIYRSRTAHRGQGEFSNTPFAMLAAAVIAVAPDLYSPEELAAYATAGMSAPASTRTSFPQSVELTFQTGVAANWLVLGSVKWTEWSVLRSVAVADGITDRNAFTSRFFFRDGWTVSGGAGHRISGQAAITAGLTWDKGVSSGWDTLTDTWTLSSGGVFDLNQSLQLRLTGALIRLTAGEKTQLANALDYQAIAPGEWGFALSAATTVRF